MPILRHLGVALVTLLEGFEAGQARDDVHSDEATGSGCSVGFCLDAVLAQQHERAEPRDAADVMLDDGCAGVMPLAEGSPGRDVGTGR
jgi:hypothetical protein